MPIPTRGHTVSFWHPSVQPGAQYPRNLVNICSVTRLNPILLGHAHGNRDLDAIGGTAALSVVKPITDVLGARMHEPLEHFPRGSRLRKVRDRKLGGQTRSSITIKS
jgi:hypothetical protein